jgi:hypothetical protein
VKRIEVSPDDQIALILHAEHALTLRDRLEQARLAGRADELGKLSAEIEDIRLRGIELQKRIAAPSGVAYERILLEFRDNSIDVWDKGSS